MPDGTLKFFAVLKYEADAIRAAQDDQTHPFASPAQALPDLVKRVNVLNRDLGHEREELEIVVHGISYPNDTAGVTAAIDALQRQPPTCP